MDFMLPDLYQYQVKGLAAIDGIRSQYAADKGRDRSIVAVLPTAGGKTQLSIYDILTHASKGDRCLFITDAVSLVSQTAKRFERYGCRPGLIAASQGKNPHPDHPVQIASFGTICNREIPKDIKLVYIDECHSAGYPESERWWADVDENGDWVHWHKDAWVVALTASPWRTKKTESLDKLYKHMVVIAQPPDLIKIGRETGFTQGLVPPVYYGAKVAVDLSAVRTSAGDYRQQDLAIALTGSGVLKATLEQWEAKCFRGTLKESMRTLYFGAGIAQSGEVAQAFNDRWREQALDEGFTDGIVWKMLQASDKDSERNYWFDRMKANDLVGLTSSDLLTQGVDIPHIECVFPRPTKSRVTKTQQEGRAARCCPEIGKKEFIIIDTGLNSFKFGRFDEVQPYSIERKLPGASFDAPMKQCPQCNALLYGFTMKCACGHVFPASAEKAQLTGDLVQLLNATDRSFQRKYRKFARKAFEMSYLPSWALIRTQEDMKLAIPAKDLTIGQLVKVRRNWLVSGMMPGNESTTIIRCAQIEHSDTEISVTTPDEFVYEIPVGLDVTVLPDANPHAMMGAKPWLSDRTCMTPATLKEHAYYWLCLTRLARSKSKTTSWARKWYFAEFGADAVDPEEHDLDQFKIA
jgi:superfamily II DNA or RNA helicase